ncbi:MAG TPA: stage II sporulation protein M, partial [Gemmatimonadaceae bacterium]|nr:stage II sporulation protein M [Gemmatimonadaceae bacterium]
VVAIESPREVRRSWRPILLAAALMFGPALIAYEAVVRQPAVAATFIPSGMLDRAEEGVRRAKENTGYIPDPEMFRPTMASRIISNNVQVTFGAFAAGITAGIGTLLILVLNGVSFGGVLGLYQSKGIIRLILAFVAPHGVLELSAVCIAGGAGFLLAAGLLLPGRRTRKRALIENGRRAIRLVAAASVMLLVAGTLEGFVSPIPSWTLSAKLAVSGATLVLMIVYLSSARERPLTPPDETAEEDPELLALR